MKKNSKSKRFSKLYLLAIFTVILVVSLISYKVHDKSIVASSVANNKEVNISDVIEDNQETIPKKVVTPEDEIIYLSDIEYTDIGDDKSSTGWGNIQKDKNPDGKTIQLIKDGEVVAYAKGMGFHANGQLIYNISKYSDIHTRFVTYMGVDASKPTAASIRIKILTSNDGITWETAVEQTEIIYSKSECISVDINVKNKSYLKIVVDNGGNGNASDHCVLAEAKLVKEDYNEKNELYSGIKTIKEYDEIISSNEDFETSYTNNYKEILEREFVNKFGYWSIQNYVKSNEVTKNVIEWVLKNQNVLENVIEVGEITDGRLFFEALGNLYEKYKDCLENDDSEVYQKMMIGLSAAYSTDYLSKATSFGIEKASYNYLERFEIMKRLFTGWSINGSTYKLENSNQFKKLHVDLIRNVMNNGLRNDEILWMNYYSTTKDKDKKYNCHVYLPYRTPVYKEAYFDENYKSTYDSKYNLTNYQVPFADGRTTRYWMIMDNGGVCWNISRVGQAVCKSNGIPACGLYQPSHEPYINYEEVDGKGVWKMQYNVGGWGKAGTTWGGGGRYRLPLNWANKYFTDENTGGPKGGTSAGYAILAQANLNDYDNFKKSIYYNLLANSYTDFSTKEAIYQKALSIDKLNLDSYEKLIGIYKENLTKNDLYDGQKWCDLLENIITNYTYYPNAMYDLFQVINPYIEEIAETEEQISSREFFIKNGLSEALAKARNVNKSNIQAGEIAQIAGRYTNEPEEIATFSFDGENANQIVLNEQYKINYQYSVNYDKNNPNGATWSTLSTDDHRLLTETELKEINDVNDIIIKMTGTDRTFTIDIEKPWCDTMDYFKGGYFNFLNYYANDLENKIINAQDSIEWRYLDGDSNIQKTSLEEENEFEWNSFSKNPPDLTGNVKIRIRLGRAGTTLESETYQDYEFTDNKKEPTRKYLPISEVRFESGTKEAENVHGDYAINGNYLQSSAVSDLKEKSGDNYFIYEFAYPIILSAVEYVPDCTKYGYMKSGKILGSMDGENWKELSKLDNIKYDDSKTQPIPVSFEGCTTFGLDNIQKFEIKDEDRIRVRYVKIVSTDSEKNEKDNVFSARMFNFFEDTVKQIPVEPTIPTADIEYSITKNTCKPVVASIISRSSKDVEITNNNDDNDGDVWSHTFTENGTYTFNLKDKDGKTGSVTANVTWIDKEAKEPEVEFSTTESTNGEVTATLKPTEDIVVLNLNTNFEINDRNCLEYIVRDDEGKEEDRIVLKDFEQDKLYKNTIDKDFSLDDDGNILDETGKIIVKNEGPKTVYDKETGEEKVVMEKGALYQYTFITNGEFTFEYVDNLGNHGQKTVNVDWIDNIAPTGLVTYDISHTTNEKVTATLSFEEENIEITNNEKNNTVVFDKNGEFIFEFKDKAGNIGEAIAKVDWIKQYISSEKYEVKNEIVQKVNQNTTLKEFKENVKSDYNYYIEDNSGNKVIDENQKIATGMKVKADDFEYSYTIIVKDDVNGDGEFTDLDIEKMCNYYFETETLDGAYFKTGDLDNDNSITLKDIAKMYKDLYSSKSKEAVKAKNLNVKLSNKINQNNTVIAYISTSDLKNKVINAFGGELSYSRDILTLTKIESVNSEWEVKSNGDKIIALKKQDTSENEKVVKLTFELKENSGGEINVDISNLKISNGEFEETCGNHLEIEIIKTIQEVPVESIEIGSTSDKFEKEITTLEVGDTINFHTTVLPEHATYTRVEWSVEKGYEDYIEVTQDGKVTAKKITDENGAKIKATIGDKFDECVIKVVPTDVKEIHDDLESEDIYLVEPNAEGVGDNISVTIAVTVLPGNATNKNVIWESSDLSVATVEDGVITAVSDNDNEDVERTCIVTVKSESNPDVVNKYTVHVNDSLVKVEKVEIELPEGKKDNTIILGEILELKAKITPEKANFKSMEWSVIEGNDVVDVDSSGCVQTKAEGETTIRLTVKCQASSCPEHIADIKLKVLPKPPVEVSSIEIQGDKEITLKKDTEMQLHVTISPDDATDKTVIWESSNNEVVSVTENGNLIAKDSGTAVITAKSGKVSDTIKVNVKAPLKTDLTVYTMSENKDFIPNLTLKLDKIVDNFEIKMYEQKTNGKFELKDLENGEYIIRIFKTLNENVKSIDETASKVAEYRFTVKDGKAIFVNKDNLDISVNSLVFIVSGNNETKVESGNAYPNVEKEYQEFVKNLSGSEGEGNNPGESTGSGEEENKPGESTGSGEEENKPGESTGSGEEENKPGESTGSGEEENKPGGSTGSGEEENKSGGSTGSGEEENKPGGSTGSGEEENKSGGSTGSGEEGNKPGESTGSGKEENNPDESTGSKEENKPNGSTENDKKEMNQKENSGNLNITLPKTSDIAIRMFVTIMIVSFMGIILIVYKKKKK